MTTTRDQPSLPLHAPVEVQPKQGGSPVPSVMKSPVMLSPRVVDENAFDDFAGRLRSLLDEAGAAAGQAQSTLTELRQLGSATSIARQKALIEAGAKLVKAVEASTARLTNASSEADAVLAKIDAASARADEAIERMEARLQSQIDAQLASFDERVEERVAQVAARMESELQARVEGAANQLQRAAEIREDLDRVVSDATDNTLVALHRASEKAARLAGWDPDDIVEGQGVGQPERDSLADLLLRAEAMQSSAKSAIEVMSTMHEDAERLVDSMRTGHDQTRDALLDLDREREHLESRLAEASIEAKRLVEDTSPILDLEERARETAGRLAQLLVETRTIQGHEEGAAKRRDHAIGLAQDALASLEPWRDVCFASEEQAQHASLPPVLRVITERFQDNLARDIHAMAQAFSAIAKRDLNG